MENKKIIRSTSAQIQLLVDYMSQNKNFANGNFSGPLGAKRIADEWESLRELLSEHGPDKSVEQWKQTWRDIKRKARKQNAEAYTSRTETDNKHFPPVSDTTMKILDTISHDCSVSIEPTESDWPPPNIPRRTQHQRMSSDGLDGVTGGDILQAQNQQNELLQKLCQLVEEQNSILSERNRIERNKMNFSKRRRLI